MKSPNTANIARLNDQLRRDFLGGSILITPGVQALSHTVRAKLLKAVRGFDCFTEDNDPHGERDFGRIDMADQQFFFKVDYYNPAMDGCSSDNSDPEVTRRVLTIMEASEY